MISLPGKNAVKALIVKSRLPKLRFLLNHFPILAYHMISESPNGFFPEDSLHDFALQIGYLKKNYDVLSLEEIAERISEGKSVRRCAAITFDDGFRDNYEKAYPILKRYQIPATIFLTTGSIDNKEAPWFIKFRFLFMHSQKSCLDIGLGGETTNFPLANAHDRRRASDRLMRYLQTCPNEERLRVLNALPTLLEVEPTGNLDMLMLTWEQIREMSRNGIHFGAHTITHPVLSQISTEIMRLEIESSKAVIEEKTGRAVKTFAYPFGRKEHYPRNAPAVLKDLGFTCAVTTEPGENAANAPLYELKRSKPWEMSFV